MTAPATTAAVAGAASYTALDAAYRASIARSALAAYRALLNGWGDVDAGNIAGTSRTWLERAVETIVAEQSNAQRLANDYTTAVRRISVPRAPRWDPAPTAAPNVEQIRKSMIYTALATTARDVAKLESSLQVDEDPNDVSAPRRDSTSDDLTREGRRRQIMQAGIKRASMAATRHITTAGRDQAEENVHSDAVAVGWARTTKPGCCYFCAMLASRGLVYKEDSFKQSNARFKGVGEQKVHDSCGCGLRPVYSRSDPLPNGYEDFNAQWIAASDLADESGEDVVLVFRRLYEGRVAPKAKSA